MVKSALALFGGALLLTACGDPTKMSTKPGGADSMFRPSPNGFSFENYDNTDVVNLTNAEMQRLFGDQVCGSMTGGCTLTPAAQEWMERMNADMEFGHSEGIAILSLRLYTQEAQARDFGKGATNAYDLDLMNNEKLQREIAYWFTTQTLIPQFPALTPSEFVGALRAGLASPSNIFTATIGVYQRNGSQGHALTPYQLIDKGEGLYTVMLYDNNTPTEERHMNLDTKAETWQYQAADDSLDPAGDYRGDATTNTLHLTPLYRRLQQQFPCPFCGIVRPGQIPSGGLPEIIMNGEGHLLITDAMGKRIGYVDGHLTNEWAEAGVVRLRGHGFYSEDTEPLYYVPGTSDLDITIDGSGLDADSQTDVGFFGPGFTMEVLELPLAPNQKDTLSVTRSGDRLRYQTAGDAAPLLVLGVQTPASGYKFQIRASGDPSGQAVRLVHDLAGGRLKILIENRASPTYNLDVQVDRIGSSGLESFSHVADPAVTLKTTDVAYLSYGGWNGTGKPMSLGIDRNNDGIIDQTIVLSDQN